MLSCKRCGSEQTVKNGKVREKSRYKCKQCGLNFVEGDRRGNESLAVKKALAVILYSLGKASFNMLGKIFGHSPSLLYRWIVEKIAKLPEPAIQGDIKEMEFDEMWHFIGSKRQTLDHQSGGSSHRANCCLGGRRS
jgi:transposase